MENDRYSELFKGKIYINVPTALDILLRKFNSLIFVQDKMIAENKEKTQCDNIFQSAKIKSG